MSSTSELEKIAPSEETPVISVVIPCYREKNNILKTIEKIPSNVRYIYCVDDGCPDATGDHVEAHCKDSRVAVLRRQSNGGVGAAMVCGYRQALADGADIVVKIDGDGQMDPQSIHRFVAPIISGNADYTKGNRFFVLADLADMPRRRLLGNAVLSFLSKLSTGYWRNFDPTNGYTAIHARVLRILPLDKLHQGYFYESDMLYRLSTLRAKVVDIPERAIYGDEQSHLNDFKAIPVFALRHLRNFVSRIFYCYFLRDFHLASLQWVLGPALMLFGMSFGLIKWIESVRVGIEASSGTVMLAGLPLIIGLQLLLSALGFDIDNQPTSSLYPQLHE